MSSIADVRVSSDTAPAPPRGAQTSTVALAIVAIGFGTALVFALDGSPLWRVVRTALTVAATVALTALVSGPPRQSPGRTHTTTTIVLSLTVGAVAVAAGLGIGLRHVLAGVINALAVAGLLQLAGGIVLLVAATRWWCTVPDSIGRFGRAWRIGVVIIATFTLAWTFGQAVAATNAPPTTVAAITPAEFGLEYQSVSFAATDGVLLAGWYLPSHNRAAVALLHGAGSTRTDVLEHARVLADNGYGVLLYDARGHGDSDGRAMDFGWYGDADVAGAIGFLNRQTDVAKDRIGVVGLSMGGEQAIGASAVVDAIDAVVAEGATYRVANDKAWLSDEFGLRGALTEHVGRLTTLFADWLTDAEPPITLRDAVIAAAPTRVLLIAASDVPGERSAARFIAEAAPDTVEIWVSPDTGHTGALRTVPDEWEQRVIGFLDEALA